MTRDQFWETIERAREGASDAYEVAAQLQRELESKTLEQIEAFLEHQARLMERSYDWSLWGAAYLLNGGCSDDGFDYFRGWLLAQGQAVFEQALRDPDSLADRVEEMDEATCEDMIGAAVSAYREKTGRYPEGGGMKLPDLGPSWDFDDDAEMQRRYPKTFAKFGA